MVSMGDERQVSAAPLKASSAASHGVAVKKQKTLKARGCYNTKWSSDLSFKPKAKEVLTENLKSELADLRQTKLMYEAALTTQLTKNEELRAEMEASKEYAAVLETIMKMTIITASEKQPCKDSDVEEKFPMLRCWRPAIYPSVAILTTPYEDIDNLASFINKVWCGPGLCGDVGLSTRIDEFGICPEEEKKGQRFLWAANKPIDLNVEHMKPLKDFMEWIFGTFAPLYVPRKISGRADANGDLDNHGLQVVQTGHNSHAEWEKCKPRKCTARTKDHIDYDGARGNSYSGACACTCGVLLLLFLSAFVLQVWCP